MRSHREWLSFLQMLLYIYQRLWRKTTPPVLCWHYTAQNLFVKRLNYSRSVISIIIYPIPSDLGSQDDSSQASSMVGDHVRSPGTERCWRGIAFYGKSSVVLTFAKSTVGDHHHQEFIFPRFLTGIEVPYRVVRPVSLSSLPQRFESFSALVRYWIPKRATPLSKAPGFELTLKPKMHGNRAWHGIRAVRSSSRLSAGCCVERFHSMKIFFLQPFTCYLRSRKSY